VGVGAGRLVVRNREDFTAKNGNERTVPLRVISEILGHSNTQVTEMYSHLSPDVMDRAMEETFGGS
jgi:site-specific recombinase XerD